MIKPELPFLETMITQTCNISCLGCTNYSDLKHSGYVPWNTGKQWLESWLDRIDIPDFGIMGGEPLINPEYLNWLQGCRRLMPNAQLRFTTNGLLLSKHPDLLNHIIELGNIVFKITVHVENQELEQNIKKIFSHCQWSPVEEFGIKRWKTKNNVRLQINRPETFIKTYLGTYESMKPHCSDPAKAFAHCVQKTCPLLYQGRIFKCSTAGLLKSVLDRFNNNDPAWIEFIDHGLSSDCDASSLDNFIKNFGKPAKICGQCPDQSTALIKHKSHVGFK